MSWLDETRLPKRAKKLLDLDLKTYDVFGVEGQDAILCSVCGKTSYQPEDIRQRYCGHCQAFHDQWDRWHQLEVAERRPFRPERQA